MKTFGRLFSGEQETEGEKESPETGFNPENIRKLIDQFLGGREGGEKAGTPYMERLRKMFEGMFGTDEGEEAEAEEEDEGEEEAVRPRPQQPAFARLREVVREFEKRLGKLEQEHREIMEMREALKPHLDQLAESAKGEIEKMGRQVKDHFATLKKELDRQRAINNRLNARIEELENVIRELMEGDEPEPAFELEPARWRDFEPKARQGGVMIVRPVKPEGAGEEGAGGVMILEPTHRTKPTKPVKPQEPKKPEVPEDRPWLGIVPSDPDEATRDELGLNVKGGCLIEKVVPGSPAEKAGMQEDDFVISFQEKKVKSSTHLRELIRDQKIGAKVKMELIRDGERITKSVKLGTVPRLSSLPSRRVMNDALPSFSDFPFPDDRKPRGCDCGRKKKDKLDKKEKRNVMKPKPQEETNLLEAIENGLQMLRSLGADQKLFIAIQDERENTLVKHELNLENLIRAFRTHIAPLLGSFGERMDEKSSCPLGMLRAHVKKLVQGPRPAEQGGPRLKRRLGMRGGTSDEMGKHGECSCECHKKHGIQQKKPQQPRRDVRRVERRVFALGDEEGFPGEGRIEVFGEGDGNMTFEIPREFQDPGKSKIRIRAKVLEAGPDGESRECCPGKCVRIFKKPLRPGKQGAVTRTFKFGGDEGFPCEARVEWFVEPEVDMFIECPEEMPFPGKPGAGVEIFRSGNKKILTPFHEEGDELPMFKFRIDSNREERFQPERPKAPKRVRRQRESI
jgi:virulence-associated protein VagC